LIFFERGVMHSTRRPGNNANYILHWENQLAVWHHGIKQDQAKTVK